MTNVNATNGAAADERPAQTKAELRDEALARFGRIIGLGQVGEDIARITQRGRDPESARFALELRSGREVRIGTIKVLWSQTELAKVLAVTVGVVMAKAKPADWQAVLAGVVRYCVDVTEVEGEGFEDSVKEWLASYLDVTSLNVDRDGAAAQGAPFAEEGHIYVSAAHLAKYVRRENSEHVEMAELRRGLCDLGFERKTINYRRGQGDKHSSKSYYVVSAKVLEPTSEVTA